MGSTDPRDARTSGGVTDYKGVDMASVANKQWVAVAQELPEEGVVVQTRSPGGMEQRLKRSGNLWFFPDGSMYVYYTPEFWRAA